jgi:hypothetical protein
MTTPLPPTNGVHHATDEAIDSLYAWFPPQAPAPTPLPEAPASVNCHITLEGRQVQLTLRDTDETRLLERLAALLKQYPPPRAACDRGPHAGPGEGLVQQAQRAHEADHERRPELVVPQNR